MSFADLVSGGVDCGPSNPLSNFSKRFGQDRGAQLDRFGSSSEAGGSSNSSKHLPSFRTQQVAGPSPSEQAFFQHQAAANRAAAFDLGPLKGALPFSPPVGPMEQDQQQLSNLDQSWHHGPANQREHFEASFRHNTPPARTSEAGWAREYSPGVALKSQNNVIKGPQHHSLQQNNLIQSSPMAFRPDMGAAGMGRLNMMGMRLGPEMHSYNSIQHQPVQNFQQDQSLQSESYKWDTAFTAIERPASPIQTNRIAELNANAVQTNQTKAETSSSDADELAKTVGRLVSTVEHETNTKFKQSNFLNLMRKIRDKQAGIQGTDIVETSSEEQESAVPATSLNKGKGKESDLRSDLRTTVGRGPSSQQEAVEWSSGLANPISSSASPLRMAAGPDSMASEQEGRDMLNQMWAEEDARSAAIERQALERSFVGDGGDIAQRRREDEAEFAKYQRIMGSDFGSAADVTSKTSMEEELFDDQASAQDFVGRKWEGALGRGVQGAQSSEWDTLQRDWDTWQATPSGLSSVKGAPASAASAPKYRFQAMNPYTGTITSNSIAQRTFMQADMQSVLEREAAVQRDPTNASAWFDLGVKQQENEREGSAIAALQQAIQLDPTLRDAWLALAVSYTNENERMNAFEAIERWIEATPDYSDVVKQHQSQLNPSSKPNQGYAERHERLTNLLIALARHGSLQNKVDADVQVALGVLFNASEDYDKAVDCFTAALSVRPEDWLLYNRLGATLSNSGRSEESLGYYHQALDLRPGFVRCHFNLSISCLNLKLYQDAASHIYTALTLQSESTEDNPQQVNEGGVTSGSLWETLRVSCELMDRPDLARLTLERDVNKFDPSDFWLEGGGGAAGAVGGQSMDQDEPVV